MKNKIISLLEKNSFIWNAVNRHGIFMNTLNDMKYGHHVIFYQNYDKSFVCYLKMKDTIQYQNNGQIIDEVKVNYLFLLPL